MRNLDLIRGRYLKEPFDKKLGHLASNLARIAGFLESSSSVTVVKDILEEAKFFIEWIAPEAPYNIQVLLSDMQLKLALWQLHLSQQKEDVKELEELKNTAKNWSGHLIKASGLLAS